MAVSSPQALPTPAPSSLVSSMRSTMSVVILCPSAEGTEVECRKRVRCMRKTRRPKKDNLALLSLGAPPTRDPADLDESAETSSLTPSAQLRGARIALRVVLMSSGEGEYSRVPRGSEGSTASPDGGGGDAGSPPSPDSGNADVEAMAELEYRRQSATTSSRGRRKKNHQPRRRRKPCEHAAVQKTYVRSKKRV